MTTCAYIVEVCWFIGRLSTQHRHRLIGDLSHALGGVFAVGYSREAIKAYLASLKTDSELDRDFLRVAHLRGVLVMNQEGGCEDLCLVFG